MKLLLINIWRDGKKIILFQKNFVRKYSPTMCKQNVAPFRLFLETFCYNSAADFSGRTLF